MIPRDPPSAPIQAPDWDAAEVIPDAVDIDAFAARHGKVAIVEGVDSSQFELRIRDDAGFWSATTVDTGAGATSAATVFIASDGLIHRIGTRSRDAGGEPPESLRPVKEIVHSRLAGGAASAEEVLFSGQRIERPFRIVEDDQGVLHAVATAGPTIRDVPTIQYLQFRDGAWSDPVEPERATRRGRCFERGSSATVVRVSARTPAGTGRRHARRAQIPTSNRPGPAVPGRARRA